MNDRPALEARARFKILNQTFSKLCNLESRQKRVADARFISHEGTDGITEKPTAFDVYLSFTFAEDT